MKTTSKLLVLWGKGSRGKTTTLNLVIEKMVKLYHAKNVAGGMPNNLAANCWIVLEFQNKKIGFITAGDSENEIKTRLNAMDAQCPDCDLYVSASRTKRSSCEYLKSNFTGHEIVWIEKEGVTSNHGNTKEIQLLQNKANDVQSCLIIEAIIMLL